MATPHKFMTESLIPLITALREELKNYGEMLARLDQQQAAVMDRQSEATLATASAIQAQADVIQVARQDRTLCQRAAARDLCLIESATFAEIIPLLPEAYRPLVQTLVEENNSLLQRVQQRGRQNHLLLSRSVELMQQFMSTLFPAHDPRTYDDRGHRLAPVLPTAPRYEAVG